METIALILFLCLTGLKPFKVAFGEVTNLIRSVVALSATAGEVAPLRGGFVVAARAGQAGSLPSQSGAECPGQVRAGQAGSLPVGTVSHSKQEFSIVSFASFIDFLYICM